MTTIKPVRNPSIKSDGLSKELSWLIDEKYGGRRCLRAFGDTLRLLFGVPLDYVMGKKDFLGFPIALTDRPLIPRNETEFWFERAISLIPTDREKPVRCLDLFSGSGCIGVALLKLIPNSHVTFADNDKKCIRQIEKNLALNNIPSHRYAVTRSDVWKNISGTFDCIFANPPYIPKTHRSGVAQDVLRFEPHGALFGGTDGLCYIKNFLAGTIARIHSGGILFFEFDERKKDAISELLDEVPSRKYELWKDQFGAWRTAV